MDYVIPGNDDAIRSVSLVTKVLADAIGEGRQEGRERLVTRATGPEFEPEPEPRPARAERDAVPPTRTGGAPAAPPAPPERAAVPAVSVPEAVVADTPAQVERPESALDADASGEPSSAAQELGPEGEAGGEEIEKEEP